MELRPAARAVVLTLCVLPIVWLATTKEARAGICDAATFGCPSSGTCVIAGTWSVGADCTLDFGSQAVELRGTLQAETRSTGFEVRAGDLVLNGGKIRSLGNTYEPGGPITIETTGVFRMTGSGARLETSGGGGGATLLVTAATIDLQTGIVSADGGDGASCGDAGLVALEAYAGPFASAATIKSTTAGNLCGGGQIAITGSSVTVTGDIDAHGGAWGADDAIVLTATASDVTVSGSALNADGTGQADGYGADGGEMVLFAPLGRVTLGGSVTARGKSPYGSGGGVLVFAAQGVSSSARMSLTAGNNGLGGFVLIETDGALAITHDIFANGGSSVPFGEGGTVELVALGPLLVTSTIDTSALVAGQIDVESASTTTISGRLIAHGSRWDGGAIDVAGCSVTVDGLLDGGGSNGALAGYVDVEGAAVTIGAAARLLASPCAGADCIGLITAQGNPAIDPAATISPAPFFVTAPELVPCPS